MHPLWFYKQQHDNRVSSTQNAFSLLFAAILVNCAPSGEMHNYCTPHIIKENYDNFLIYRCNYILLSQVYCVWQVVKTPTIILNNPVLSFLLNVWAVGVSSATEICPELLKYSCFCRHSNPGLSKPCRRPCTAYAIPSVYSAGIFLHTAASFILWTKSVSFCSPTFRKCNIILTL